MGILYDIAVARGATVVGFTDTSEYDYIASVAERDGQLVGLALDEDGESSKINKRIEAWTTKLL